MAQASAGAAPKPGGKTPPRLTELLIDKPRLFYQQVRNEMAKVSWPSKDNVRTYATVVIVATVIVCILMGVWDAILNEVLALVLGMS